MATKEGTWRYREQFTGEFARTFYRSFQDYVVASIGLGTYLGEPSDRMDRAYREVTIQALESGINVLDTAINYRHQRSERAVGAAIETAEVDRESVLVATKGGYVAFDGTRPADPASTVRQKYVESGVIEPDELVNGHHSLAPSFLSAQLDRSLENLGLQSIDLYYVHNPETQLATHSRSAVYDQLERVFERLEERVTAGDIRHYGVATWDAFRVPAGADRYLSLETVVDRARKAATAVGNETSHLAAIQLPFNVEMADAFTVSAHGPSGGQSALEFATDADLAVFTSASLHQGTLAKGLPDAVAARLEGETNPQRALNFARSAPGVVSALVGTTSTDHLRENIAAGTHEPLGARAFDAVFD